MQDLTLVSDVRWGVRGLEAIALLALLLSLSACGQGRRTSVPPRSLNIEQNWELAPGQIVAGHRISGGLGDISVEINGKGVYAPFTGTVYPHGPNCIVFASPEVPAYLLRLCDIRRPKLGEVQQGKRLGTGQTIHFATLRKQPTGEWAIVEPAKAMVERLLTKPSEVANSL